MLYFVLNGHIYFKISTEATFLYAIYDSASEENFH